MYVQVVVNVPQISGVFDYHLPPEMMGKVLPGCLVEVPFGKQTVQGIVLREVAVPQVPETRPVLNLLDPLPVITPSQLKLAETMSEELFSSLSTSIELMLPPGLSQHADTEYVLIPAHHQENRPLTAAQRKILAMIEKRGSIRGRQIASAFPHQDWRSAVQNLIKQGSLSGRPVLLSPSVRAKYVRTVKLAAVPQVVRENWEKLGKKEALERRQAVMRFLLAEPWEQEVATVYAMSGAQLSDLKKLAELGLVVLGEQEIWRDPLDHIEPTLQQPPQLTDGQNSAWELIGADIERAMRNEPVPPVLLRGVTGSGKTELYLRAVELVLKHGRQAIVLVPEISLTPQTTRRFLARFPGQVGLMHSRLSSGERYDTWRRARAGLLPIIVGPRSALFAPLPNLGLIVMDECHDGSYYQSETPPFFHAVQVALDAAKINGAMLLLGSATPPTELFHRAEKSNWRVIHLPERILAHRQTAIEQTERMGHTVPDWPTEGDSSMLPLPQVEVVDMRQELKAGNRSIFSRSLSKQLENVLTAGQQALLFLNRRGSSTYVFCRSCGYSIRCPRCDLPLTYHAGDDRLRCHTCNYERNLPEKCPQCGSPHIRQYGMGTEKVEQELQKQFPAARILRYDAETTRQKGAHELLLSHFSRHQADILVGTQMLAKGLDLPLVTFVGVILADVGLNFPDFRAGERTFQLLTQVAGRAGRSPLGGKVIFQTFQPEVYPIQAAAKHDFEGFYQRELMERRKMGYPPFSKLVRLEMRGLKLQEVEQSMMALAQQIHFWMDRGDFPATEMIGPVPCFFSRMNGYYRWQIILRGPNPAQVLKGRTLENVRVEVEPLDLL